MNFQGQFRHVTSVLKILQIVLVFCSFVCTTAFNKYHCFKIGEISHGGKRHLEKLTLCKLAPN